jgi:hypothetical protein
VICQKNATIEAKKRNVSNKSLRFRRNKDSVNGAWFCTQSQESHITVSQDMGHIRPVSTSSFSQTTAMATPSLCALIKFPDSNKHHPRPPEADKPSSRTSKVKTWLVQDPLSHIRLPRFYLCHFDEPESKSGANGLNYYTMTYHPETKAKPSEQEKKLRAFEHWAQAICLRNVPNEVEMWQVDLTSEEAEEKKPLYESFFGIKLVEWTQKIPYVHRARMGEARPQPKPSKVTGEEESTKGAVRSGRVESTSKVKSKEKMKEKALPKTRNFHGVQLEGMNDEERKAEITRVENEVAWAKQRGTKKIVRGWDLERAGLKQKGTSRYFVQMPDYCFIGDDLEQENRQAWDTFGECMVKSNFHMSLQRVQGFWLDFKCNIRASHECTQWRAYLYEPRPIRPYDEKLSSRKREHHLMTEEETEYEHRAKRRWLEYQGKLVTRPQASAPVNQRHHAGPRLGHFRRASSMPAMSVPASTKPGLPQSSQSSVSSQREEPSPNANSSLTHTPKIIAMSSPEIITITSDPESSKYESDEEETGNLPEEAPAPEKTPPEKPNSSTPKEPAKNEDTQKQPATEKLTSKEPASRKPIQEGEESDSDSDRSDPFEALNSSPGSEEEEEEENDDDDDDDDGEENEDDDDAEKPTPEEPSAKKPAKTKQKEPVPTPKDKGEQINQEEDLQEDLVSEPHPSSSPLSSAMDSDDLADLERETYTWKGKQKGIGRKYQKMEHL